MGRAAAAVLSATYILVLFVHAHSHDTHDTDTHTADDDQDALALLLAPLTSTPFPPTGQYSTPLLSAPAQFWSASVKLPLANGPYLTHLFNIAPNLDCASQPKHVSNLGSGIKPPLHVRSMCQARSAVRWTWLPLARRRCWPGSRPLVPLTLYVRSPAYWEAGISEDAPSRRGARELMNSLDLGVRGS